MKRLSIKNILSILKVLITIVGVAAITTGALLTDSVYGAFTVAFIGGGIMIVILENI